MPGEGKDRGIVNFGDLDLFWNNLLLHMLHTLLQFLHHEVLSFPSSRATCSNFTFFLFLLIEFSTD